MTRQFNTDECTLTLKASLYTFIKYKTEFRRELLYDLASGDYRTYVRVLYVLCCEGMELNESFDEFINSIGEFNIAELVRVVSELYVDCVKVSKRNRTSPAESDEDTSPMPISELCVMLFSVGFSMADFHDITLGFALDVLHEKARSIRRANGEQVQDPERQYRVMKADQPLIEQMHKDGKISDADYQRYMKAITDWEADE